jgi:hypothetical protein
MMAYSKAKLKSSGDKACYQAFRYDSHEYTEKQSRIADKGCFSSLDFREGLTTPHCKNNLAT